MQNQVESKHSPNVNWLYWSDFKICFFYFLKLKHNYISFSLLFSPYNPSHAYLSPTFSQVHGLFFFNLCLQMIILIILLSRTRGITWGNGLWTICWFKWFSLFITSLSALDGNLIWFMKKLSGQKVRPSDSSHKPVSTCPKSSRSRG